MQAFVLFIILAVTCSGYLVFQGWLPGSFALLPEAISGAVLVLVVVMGARNRFQDVRPAYWLTFLALALVALFGILANGVDAGPVIAGTRTYIRALPLFLLPAVYSFTAKQVRTQMYLLLAVTAIQLPLSIRQKTVDMFYGNTSGDFVAGTLLGSGLLSIFLICAACLVTGFYARRRISLPVWLMLLLLCIAPTSINETKATFLLLPIGLLVTFWSAAEPRARLKNLLAGTATLFLLGALIIPVYDYWAAQRPASEGGGVSVLEFFSDSDRFDEYVNYAPDKEGALPGRGQAYRTVLADVTSDPIVAVLGFGVGNASTSNLGEAFAGAHGVQYERLKQTTAILFMLEIGFVGLLLGWLLNYLCYQDAQAISRRDQGYWGALACGWCGAVAVIVVASVYAELLGSTAISYLFWYISGLLAAQRVRAPARSE